MSVPVTLTAASKKIWGEICKAHQLERAQELILQTALEQYDLYMQFRKEVQRDGASTAARDGIKAHPAVSAMKTARDGFLAAWKMLGIGIEIREVGRPTDDRELEWASKLNLVKQS